MLKLKKCGMHFNPHFITNKNIQFLQLKKKVKTNIYLCIFLTNHFFNIYCCNFASLNELINPTNIHRKRRILKVHFN